MVTTKVSPFSMPVNIVHFKVHFIVTFVVMKNCCGLLQGNQNICKSPDEYTINVASSRGLKEFQFDQIFMPDSTQEKVFEDTNVSVVCK